MIFHPVYPKKIKIISAFKSENKRYSKIRIHKNNK